MVLKLSFSEGALLFLDVSFGQLNLVNHMFDLILRQLDSSSCLHPLLLKQMLSARNLLINF